jgi:ABC-type nitrate/sulfonate/bicarbonate transport system permease component
MSARQDRRDKIASRAVQIGFVAAVIGLWYCGTAYWGISRILLPNPVNVWSELKDVIGSGEFLPDLRVTLTELAVALPVMLTGLRIGFTVALLSILGSETIASLEGLGHRIVHLAEAMETARMFAYIAFAVVIAATLNGVVSSLERRAKRR